MLKRGNAPYYECSTRGDRKFSAFVAKPKSLDGKTIEEAYQAMKIFEDGTTGLSWRQAKGRTPINRQECVCAYEQWWREYIDENPELLSILQSKSGLSDMFGKEGSVCQAEVLWRIRCESLTNEK